jgi:predicted alpha/beta-fold hydrolase
MSAAFAVNTFKVPDFIPPLWARNAHFQTIAGALLTRAPKGFHYTHRVRLHTPDGDWFEVDCAVHGAHDERVEPGEVQDSLPATRAARPLAVVLHGLESCSRGIQTLQLANMLYNGLGANVYAMNFRGCSGEPNATPKSYHLGETSDLKLLIEELRSRVAPVASDERAQPLLLSGFSLGGNVICKYLGEFVEHARLFGVTAAAVYCVPFDALASQPVLDSGLIRRYVYSRRFVRSIQNKLKNRRLSTKVPYDLERVLRAETIGEIDDAYIAPTYGFKDRFDYYRKCSCGQFLEGVRTPLLIINARDDPFMAPSSLPIPEEIRNPMVCLAYTSYGGHCGFFSGMATVRGDSWIGSHLQRFFEWTLEQQLNDQDYVARCT